MSAALRQMLQNRTGERDPLQLKTGLIACIGRSGPDDKLAVCEDISPVGMCFRSKSRYAD
jgi:hypothetical protein